MLALEQAGGYRGYYFVLHGKLSPIDGIGPDELGLERLQERIDELQPEELILATTQLWRAKRSLTISVVWSVNVCNRSVALPMAFRWGEIEYTDGGTLSHASQGRRYQFIGLTATPNLPGGRILGCDYRTRH